VRPRTGCPPHRFGRICANTDASGASAGVVRARSGRPGSRRRVGIEPLGDDDFYGQSIRDMDLDMIHEVRNTWQFYRDRRPEMYEDLVEL
jgi:hypothetical protein